MGRQKEQVNPEDVPYAYENLVFIEPVSIQELNAVPEDDPYPDIPDEE